MPTEDAYSSGRLVLSHFGTCMCSKTNRSWTCLVSGLLNFEHSSEFLFCLIAWLRAALCCHYLVSFIHFSNTFLRMESETDKHAHFQRCKLIYEFSRKPFLPMPIGYFIYIYRLFLFIYEKCCKRKDDDDDDSYKGITCIIGHISVGYQSNNSRGNYTCSCISYVWDVERCQWTGIWKIKIIHLKLMHNCFKNIISESNKVVIVEFVIIINYKCILFLNINIVYM